MNKKFSGGAKDSGKHAGKEKKADSGFARPRKDDGFAKPRRPEKPERTEKPGRPERPERKEDYGKKTYKSRPDKKDKPFDDNKGLKESRYVPREDKAAPGKEGAHSSRPGKYPSKDKKFAKRKPSYEPKESRYIPSEDKQAGRGAPKEFAERKTAYEKKPSAPVKIKKDWDKDDRAQREAVEDDRLILKGRHEVVQALESGQTIDSVVISTAVKGPVGKIVRELAGKSQIPVKEMNPDLFERKFGEKSQGIVALGGSFTYCSLEEIVVKADAANQILVALNHVEDARNLGAIVRTVEASGCSGILLPKHRSAGMSEWAVRTAQGAASYLPVARVNNLGDALEQLKALGYWVIGLDGDAPKSYDQVVYSGKLVLVAGGEDAGLGERVRKVCDDVVAIPLAGKTPSLNVSVSTAVVLYEIIRQKQFFQK